MSTAKETSVDLTGERDSFTTQLAAPWSPGEPQVQFVTTSSAVMFAELNPENAKTEYWFEYAPGKEALAQCQRSIDEYPSSMATCGGVERTPVQQSSVYGAIGATAEAVGLQPDTQYSYRLYAENENNAKTEKYATAGAEAAFTTASAPSPVAITGQSSEITPTSAIVNGTVNPDGAPATYAFELGVYAGTATQYGVVASGSTGEGTTPVPVSYALSGLQPGTTYAYRIAISSGYGAATGAMETFTTLGLPAVLQTPSVLAQLPVPPIPFPKALSTPSSCKHGYTRNKQGKCVKVKPKKKQKKRRPSKA